MAVADGQAWHSAWKRPIVVNVGTRHQECIDAGIYVKAVQAVGRKQCAVQPCASHVGHVVIAVSKAVDHDLFLPARLGRKLVFEAEADVVLVPILGRINVNRAAIDDRAEVAGER